MKKLSEYNPNWRKDSTRYISRDADHVGGSDGKLPLPKTKAQGHCVTFDSDIVKNFNNPDKFACYDGKALFFVSRDVSYSYHILVFAKFNGKRKWATARWFKCFFKNGSMPKYAVEIPAETAEQLQKSATVIPDAKAKAALKAFNGTYQFDPNVEPAEKDV